MAIPKSVKNELQIFEDACNEFVGSKLILIEKSISRILKTIAKGGQIYNVIAEEIVGYNFPAEFESVLRSNSFDLVQSEKKFVPFVFNLLNEMDNGNIDIFSFIKNVFGDDSQSAYQSFSDVVIKNFLFEIKRLLEERYADLEETLEEDNGVELPILDDAFINRIKFVMQTIMDGLANKKNAKLKTKGDINTICVSVLVCIANSEYIGLLGLLLGIKNMLSKIRFFKNDIKELDIIIKSFNEI